MTALASSYPSTSTTCAPRLFDHANPTAPQSFLELLQSPIDPWSFDNGFLLQLSMESGWSSDSSSINLFESGDGVVANAVEPVEGDVDDTPTLAPLWPSQPPYLPSHHTPVPSFPPSSSSQFVTMSNTNNKPHEPTSPKRSAADDEDFGREAHADKKPRVSIEEVPDEETTNKSCQAGVDINSDCALLLPPPGVAAPCPPPTETPTKVDIPPPPRSPSPPRHLDTRPAVPSPLSPPAPPCVLLRRPQATRRRSRSHEIGLLKFALDPWLRLSRTLEPVKNSFGGGCRSFNPATFPRAGNLRDLRGWNRCSPFGNGVTTASNHISFGVDVLGGLQFGEPEPVRWNLVDA